MRVWSLLLLFVILACVSGENFNIKPGTSPVVEGITRAYNGIRKLLVRKPPMKPREVKLFVASLPRTGTASLEAALERLGFSAMHGGEYLDHAHIIEDFHTGRMSQDEVFEYIGRVGYDVAGMDLMYHFWRWAAQREAIPVILTVRDVDKWVESVKTLSELAEALGQPPFSFSPKFRHTQKLLQHVLTVNITGGSPDKSQDSEVLKAGYERHVQEVTTAIPASRLLVFDVRDGWEPLCRFLGKPVPDEPFPRVNDGATLKVAIRVLRSLTWLLCVPPALLLLLIWCCCRPRRARGAKGKSE